MPHAVRRSPGIAGRPLSNRSVRMLRFVPLLLTLAACSSPDPVELHGSTMGTTWTVTLGGPLDEAQVAQAESIIAAILAEADAVLSGWNAASEISVINRRAETSGIALSEALYTVLDAGTTVQEETGGAVDVTGGPRGVRGGRVRRPGGAAARAMGMRRRRHDHGKPVERADCRGALPRGAAHDRA